MAATTKKAPTAAKSTSAATKKAGTATKAAAGSAKTATADAVKAATTRSTSTAKSATTAAKAATTRATKSAKTAATSTKTDTKTAATSAATSAAHAAEQAIPGAEHAPAAKPTVAETAAAKATAALKSFPIDFSKFDVETLRQLDPRKIDWSKIDWSSIERPDLDRQKLLGAARDAAYVVVGFGVLAVQRAQVRRRELADSISERFGANRKQVEDLIAGFETRLTNIDDAVEARLDHAIEMIGERLPDPAETLLNQVHNVAKTARRRARGMLLTNAA
jgi:hypothetical protein